MLSDPVNFVDPNGLYNHPSNNVAFGAGYNQSGSPFVQDMYNWSQNSPMGRITGTGLNWAAAGAGEGGRRFGWPGAAAGCMFGLAGGLTYGAYDEATNHQTPESIEELLRWLESLNEN